MAALTTYASDKCLNAILRDEPLSPPSTLYMALYSTPQTVGETGTECTDANYARQQIAFNAASSQVSTNNGTVTFPALTSNFSMASAGLCDAVTAGHCWIFDNQGAPIEFLAGNAPTLPDMSGTVSAF